MLTKEQTIEKTMDYIEYILDGPENAGTFFSYWKAEDVAITIFEMVSAGYPSLSFRKIAIAIVSGAMNAIREKAN